MKNSKIIFFILYIFSNIQICIGQENPEDELKNLTTLNLKGNVKSITEKSFNAKKDGVNYIKTVEGWQSSWKKNNEQKFDVNGNLIDKTYFENSKPIRTEFFKYENNKITETNTLYTNRFFTYDEFGKIKSEKFIDKKPKKITTGKENIPIKIETLIEYFYSQNSKLEQKIERTLSGNQISVQNFKYDQNNNLIYKELKYSSRKEWYDYYYSTDNLLYKIEWKDDKFGLLEETFITYNNREKKTENWTNYFEGEKEGSIEYNYEKGNEIETKEFDADGNLENAEKISYTYDKFGNWINKTIILKSKAYIIERQILYY
jgi:Lhr-like helicase